MGRRHQRPSRPSSCSADAPLCPLWDPRVAAAGVGTRPPRAEHGKLRRGHPLSRALSAKVDAPGGTGRPQAPGPNAGPWVTRSCGMRRGGRGWHGKETLHQPKRAWAEDAVRGPFPPRSPGGHRKQQGHTPCFPSGFGHVATGSTEPSLLVTPPTQIRKYYESQMSINLTAKMKKKNSLKDKDYQN